MKSLSMETTSVSVKNKYQSLNNVDEEDNNTEIFENQEKTAEEETELKDYRIL